MGLSRCRDRQKEDELRFEPYGTDPLSFIGARCLPLQLALLHNRIDLDDIVKNVRAYKWVTKNWTLKKGRIKKASWRVIRARRSQNQLEYSEMTQGDYVKISSTNEVDQRLKNLEARIKELELPNPTDY